MIDAKQLMIGNLVYKDLAIMLVNEIDEYGYNGRPTINGWPEEDFEPIPLTPEWLERCEFKTPDGYQKTVYYNEIMIDYHMGQYKLRDKPKAQLKYLHQLQNVFYALIGQELTIRSFNQSN